MLLNLDFQAKLNIMNENISIDSIIEKIKNLELPDVLKDLFGKIASGARQLGRFATGQLLMLYYVLKEGDLSGSEKAWIYAALVYVLVPGDLIPRRVLHILGITDDALAIGYVIAKVKDKITPQIEQKVATQLDKWFGYEISVVDEQ